MQALYQLDMQADSGISGLGCIEGFFRENTDEELVLKLALEWTRGAWEKLRDCDELISAASIKWPLSRLSRVDKSILRLAVYQLRFCPDMPPKVAINEAIELAKKYSTEQSAGFVNGVLDAVLKHLAGEK
jgi:transcription antitermination factor NusB